MIVLEVVCVLMRMASFVFALLHVFGVLWFSGYGDHSVALYSKHLVIIVAFISSSLLHDLYMSNRYFMVAYRVILIFGIVFVSHMIYLDFVIQNYPDYNAVAYRVLELGVLVFFVMLSSFRKPGASG
jgi:hypothetical protein